MEAFGSTKLSGIPKTSFSQGAMYIEMTKCRAFPRRQCFQLLFITHPVIVGDKIFTPTLTTTQVCDFAMPCFDDYNIKQYLIDHQCIL
jgi:hypothetical protein